MDPVDIANLGLGWLGVKPIASFTEPTTPARRVQGAFNGLRDAVLEDAEWSFATRRASLPRDPTTPLFGYASRYALGPEVITVVKAFPSASTGIIDAFAASMDPPDSDALVWVVEQGLDAGGAQKRYILADTLATSLWIKAVMRVEDYTLWSPSFCQAMAARLAADLCLSLTQDKGLAASMWQLYRAKIEAAKGNDAKQGKPEQVFRVSQLAMRRR